MEGHNLSTASWESHFPDGQNWFSERDGRGYSCTLCFSLPVKWPQVQLRICSAPESTGHGCLKNFRVWSFAETDHLVILSAISGTSWILMDSPENQQLSERTTQHQTSLSTRHMHTFPAYLQLLSAVRAELLVLFLSFSPKSACFSVESFKAFQSHWILILGLLLQSFLQANKL